MSFKFLRLPSDSSEPTISQQPRRKFSHSDSKMSKSRTSTSQDSESEERSSSEEEPSTPNVERVRKNRAVIYWISYVDRDQRVLSFTQDEAIFMKIRSIVDAEPANREIFFALAGVGLSLVIIIVVIINEILLFMLIKFFCR